MKSPEVSSTPFPPRGSLLRRITGEWRQYLLLARSFWLGFFENDLVSRQSDTGLGIPHILALVALPGMMLPLLLKLKYIGLAGLPETIVLPYTWDDKLFLVSYSMTMAGLLAIVVWDRLFLDNRDFVILSPVPVPLSTICLAKISAVVFFPAVFLLAIVHVSPLLMAALLLPIPGMTDHGKYVVAHAVAVFGAGAFTFLFVVALLAILVNLCGYRLFRRVAGYVQFVLSWSILSLILFYPRVLAAFDPVRGLDPVVRLFPPMWFLGLFEVLLGRSEAAFRQLAASSVHAVAIVAGTALLGTLGVYLFRIQGIREYQHPSGSKSGFVSAINRLVNQILLKHPLERAVFHFMLQTLLRRPAQRMILTAYTGVGIAFAVDGLLMLFARGSDGGIPGLAPLLSVHLILSFFLVSGMRFVFTLPAEVPANWVFRVTESGSGQPYISAVRKVMLLAGILPCALLTPSYVFLLGWETAVANFLYGVVCALLFIELLLVNFHKVPFTCTYLPGKAQLLTRWVLYWFAFSIYGYQLAVLEEWALRSFWKIGPLIALLMLLSAGLSRWNRKDLEETNLVFDEQPESLCGLNLCDP